MYGNNSRCLMCWRDSDNHWILHKNPEAWNHRTFVVCKRDIRGFNSRESREMYQMQIFAFRHHSIFDAALSERIRRMGRGGRTREGAFSKGGERERGNGRIYILTSRFHRRQCEVEKSYLHPSSFPFLESTLEERKLEWLSVKMTAARDTFFTFQLSVTHWKS